MGYVPWLFDSNTRITTHVYSKGSSSDSTIQIYTHPVFCMSNKL